MCCPVIFHPDEELPSKDSENCLYVSEVEHKPKYLKGTFSEGEIATRT